MPIFLYSQPEIFMQREGDVIAVVITSMNRHTMKVETQEMRIEVEYVDNFISGLQYTRDNADE